LNETHSLPAKKGKGLDPAKGGKEEGILNPSGSELLANTGERIKSQQQGIRGTGEKGEGREGGGKERLVSRTNPSGPSKPTKKGVGVGGDRGVSRLPVRNKRRRGKGGARGKEARDSPLQSSEGGCLVGKGGDPEGSLPRKPTKSGDVGESFEGQPGKGPRKLSRGPWFWAESPGSTPACGERTLPGSAAPVVEGKGKPAGRRRKKGKMA